MIGGHRNGQRDPHQKTFCIFKASTELDAIKTAPERRYDGVRSTTRKGQCSLSLWRRSVADLRNIWLAQLQNDIMSPVLTSVRY